MNYNNSDFVSSTSEAPEKSVTLTEIDIDDALAGDAIN